MYTYKGLVIYVDRGPGRFTGYKLPYSTQLPDGEQLSADTLTGIKELVNERLRELNLKHFRG